MGSNGTRRFGSNPREIPPQTFFDRQSGGIPLSDPGTLFVNRRRVAEAIGDNPQLLLALDHRVPGRIVAFVSPEIQREVTKQWVRDPDLDGVCIGASLRTLIDEFGECVEDDDEIDRLVGTLSEAIDQLRTLQKERHAFLETQICERCSHTARLHFRPHVGEISCQQTDCQCEAFDPLVESPSKRNSSLLRSA
jgi:hypothetical protein